MDEFNGRTALISGATRGIGKAIAKRFLEAGAHIVGVYAGNNEAAQAFADDNQQFSDRFELFQCNIADEKQVAALFRKIEEKHQSLDILVNNAGIRRDAMLAMMSYNQWQDVLNTNLTGTYLMAKQAVLLMMKHKYGRIINITSPVAHLGFSGQANYAASKAGQVALTKTLAKEVARKKITVNCVSPGFISTDFILDLHQDLLAEYKKMVPMRRFGTPEEVADAVIFLAGSRAAYISGTVLEVSGGL
ncbi:MAG: 3-oxoacyl-ACP reductase FabG [Proteobacteria bacterium]|nr:3-oxoacyl-ACP reductase FabG [Pseudomonadota bacterium]